MNCSMNFIYESVFKDPGYVDGHQHQCYELVYYIGGTGETKIAGTRYTYAPSTYTIISPQQIHNETHHTQTDLMFIGFTIDTPALNLEDGLYLDTDDHIILTMLRRIRTEMKHKRPFYAVKLDLFITELVIELIRKNSIKLSLVDDIDETALTYTKQFVEENYNRKISLETLADLSGYSYHYFRHQFKKIYGMSPMSYVIQMRINGAKRMLTHTDDKISVIALENGFSTSSQFCQIFKKVMGITPAEFRSQQQETKYK